MSASAATHSMQDLLDTLTRESRSKLAADNVEPGTSSGLSGTPESEATYTEGERSAENDAFIRENLGTTGAEGAPPASAHEGDYDQAHRAAKIAPTGEDPASESNSKSPPSEAEPGTSASGLSLGEKVSVWTKEATELLVDYSVDAKLGEKTASQATPPAEAEEPQYDNPYMALAEGNEEEAKQAYAIVQEQLVQSHLEGEKLAYVTANYLNDLQGELKAKPAPIKVSANVQRKLSMGEEAAPPEDGGGEPPMPAGEGDPAAAMMGGEGGEAVEGGGDEAMMQDPAVIEQALVELAGEIGVSPEELLQMLEEEGAGGEMGGAPPEMAGGEMGGAPPEMPKAANDLYANFKVAAAINSVKKRAIDALREKSQRGRR